MLFVYIALFVLAEMPSHQCHKIVKLLSWDVDTQGKCKAHISDPARRWNILIFSFCVEFSDFEVRQSEVRWVKVEPEFIALGEH